MSNIARETRFIFAASATLLVTCSSWVQPAPPAPAPGAEPVQANAEEPKKAVIHPEADRLLKATSDVLAAAKQFSCKAEVWSDEIVGGTHKVSTTKTLEMEVSRPNRLHVETHSPKRSRGIWYDGKVVTMLDRATNLYAVVDAPDSIDKTVYAMNAMFGVSIPLDDLILSDPYASAKPALRSGAYFGKTTILGVPCRHLAFSTDNVYWQLWIEDGGQHMPRKIVITYKLEDAAPQYTAIFSDWVLNQPIPDSSFAFTAPKGSAKIEVLKQNQD